MFTKIFVSWMLLWLIHESVSTVNHEDKHFITGNHLQEYVSDDLRNDIMADKTVLESPSCKENCLANDDFDVASNKIIKRGRAPHEDNEKQYMVERKFKQLPLFLTHTLKSCACGREKRLIDMGPDYFPRYISDMLCIPGGCAKHHECLPKRSKIWTIRRRQEDEYPGTEPVPKELREFWIGETISATVDCECTHI